MKEQLQNKINNKTKPLGALGRLEALALQIGLVQKTTNPEIKNPHIVVFAADHGVASITGNVSPFPQAVTAQMVLNFVHGGAAINVFCKQNNVGLTVVDAGVNFDFDNSLPIIHNKIRKGTNDYTNGSAMPIEEVQQCLAKGGAIVEKIFNEGCNTIGFGEMGIGNTSSASLLMHHYLGLPIAECVGRGTGVNDAQLQNKINVLTDASNYHELANYDSSTPYDILGRVGGFEIAMMAGAYIKAYALGMLIVVDGFIATAALLSAINILSAANENQLHVTGPSSILDSCVLAHCSNEQGHLKMLKHLQVNPLLQLDLRLGEGTGAALAIPLLQNACAFINNMASFDSAGVDNKD